MLVRTYRNARATQRPVYVAAKGGFPSEIDARLECPVVIDRWPGSGPLAALVSALDAIRAPRVFVLAGDEPRADEHLAATLAQSWRDGDDAVVPEHDDGIEPLAALYDCGAIRREGYAALRERRTSMHAFLERLSVRRVPVSGSFFTNLNTPEALARIERAR
jgi:molybdopterin-guanine dinucleotide biosynthesis protein A